MKCERCGKEFQKNRSDQRFCGATCRFKFANNKRVTRVNDDYTSNTDKLKDKEMSELKKKIAEQDEEIARINERIKEIERNYSILLNKYNDSAKDINQNFRWIKNQFEQISTGA